MLRALGCVALCVGCSVPTDIAEPRTASGGSSSGGSSSGGSSSGGNSAGGLAGESGASGSTSGGGASTGGAAGEGSGGIENSGGGGGEVTCPTNGPPSGSATLRFDVAALSCASGGTCTGAEDKCFCQPDFEALNVSPAHFMALGSDMQKEKVWAQGNFQAVYVDDLNTDWSAGGAARASAVMTKAAQTFPCGVPSWIIVNEISAGLWPSDASYRDYVVAFAKSLSQDHGRSVVIAAPFDGPGANGAWWVELQKHAFVGAEVYLSGKEVNYQANSVSWCQSQYQAAVNAYAAVGVPKSRLFLFEHFANSSADKGWGRAGVSVAGWKNAIKARNQAIAAVGFAGFVSYGWGGNDMHAPESDRLSFMTTYTAMKLP